MARIEIDLPKSLPFSTELKIHIYHVNQTGHLDNALLFNLVGEARHRFFLSIGIGEDDLSGVKCVVVNERVKYCSEAFYGETVLIEMGFVDLSESTGMLGWRMHDVASGREVAKGISDIEFVDAQTQESVKMTEPLLNRVSLAS